MNYFLKCDGPKCSLKSTKNSCDFIKVFFKNIAMHQNDFDVLEKSNHLIFSGSKKKQIST